MAATASIGARIDLVCVRGGRERASSSAINESLKVIFNCQWVTAFRQNKGVDIGRQILKLRPGKCFLCLKILRSLCCKQVRETAATKSQQTNIIYKIFHNVNSASRYVIYLMEDILWNKQNVGKAGISFNIRLNNHSKDVKKSRRNNGLLTFSTRKPQFQQTCKIYSYRWANKHLQI